MRRSLVARAAEAGLLPPRAVRQAPAEARPTPGADPAPARPLVAEVREARVGYGERAVLDGLTLGLRAGEIYALLGPNGAGKSTLLRVLCGRLALASGSAAILGADPRRSAATRRRIGFVPQSVALYPRLTVRENLEALGRLAGVTRRRLRGRVEAALAQTGLETVAGTLVGTLSGGYGRRVNLAAALLAEPALLLLDEPSVGIDREAGAVIEAGLRRLADTGIAILLVTHDFRQAGALADRVGLLAAGRLVREGRPRDLLPTGGRREIVVSLEASPDAPQRAILRRLGLAPASDALTWASPSESAGGVDVLLGALAANGLRPRQVASRAWSLDALYRTLIDPGADR